MLQTIKSCNNMMVSPHWMATQAGIDIMRNGGNAIEAMITSAAVISVVYPHMNSLGGDNFWLINTVDQKLIGIEATGFSLFSAASITIDNSLRVRVLGNLFPVLARERCSGHLCPSHFNKCLAAASLALYVVGFKSDRL